MSSLLICLLVVTTGGHCPIHDTTHAPLEHRKLETAYSLERGRMGNSEELDLAYPDDDVGVSTGR